MSGTIRDNILFSHHYDETFYNLVLDGNRDRPNNSYRDSLMVPSLCTATRLDPSF